MITTFFLWGSYDRQNIRDLYNCVLDRLCKRQKIKYSKSNCLLLPSLLNEFIPIAATQMSSKLIINVSNPNGCNNLYWCYSSRNKWTTLQFQEPLRQLFSSYLLETQLVRSGERRFAVIVKLLRLQHLFRRHIVDAKHLFRSFKSFECHQIERECWQCNYFISHHHLRYVQYKKMETWKQKSDKIREQIL